MERSSQGTQIFTRENSETEVEEDKSYANCAAHSPDTLSATEKVLGLKWNKAEDVIILDLTEVANDLSLEEWTRQNAM